MNSQAPAIETGFRRKALYGLLKPGLAAGILITVAPGMYLHGRSPSAELIFFTLLGTFLTAMSSFAYNQLIEMRTDALMHRTRERVLPSGSLSVPFVAAVGSALLLLGLLILSVRVNPIAALAALASFLIYVFLYTMLLKPRTDMNTVVGGLSGSIGPLIGEAASHGTITFDGFALFFLIFLWQPPHFWALAINLREDYARANLPMLPVTRGVTFTTRRIIAYYWLLLFCMTLVYFPLNIAGLAFLIPALAMGGFVLSKMYQLKKTEDPALARRVFGFSILHMTLWHVFLLIDGALGRPGLIGP